MSETEERFCSKLTKSGEPCKARAIRGSEPAICFSHARTSDDQRKAQRIKVAKHNAKKRDPLELLGEVTRERVIDIASRCLGGIPLDTLEPTATYFGPREVTPEGVYTGLMLLLILTGPHTTPNEAREALLETVPESMRPSYTPPPEDIYRAGRADWRRASLMYREVTGLFVDPYPPTLIAPWEDRETVERNEPLPTFEDWTTEPLGDSTTHVRATTPSGEEIIVRRQKVQESVAA